MCIRDRFYCLLHIGKCQGILLELRIEKRLIEIGFSRLRVNPVSYTHLDVYKRQVVDPANVILFNVIVATDS